MSAIPGMKPEQHGALLRAVERWDARAGRSGDLPADAPEWARVLHSMGTKSHAHCELVLGMDLEVRELRGERDMLEQRVEDLEREVRRQRWFRDNPGASDVDWRRIVAEEALVREWAEDPGWTE